MFAERAVRQLNGVEVPCFDDHPGPVCIERFAEANAVRDAPACDLLEILFSGIDERRLIPGVGCEEFCVAVDQPAFVGRDRSACWFPVFKAKIEQREEAPVKCGVANPREISNQYVAESDF